MGAKQSKRSVDITNTPTKGEVETIGEGEGRVVRIGDADIKTTTNGAVPHTDLEIGEKDENVQDLTVENEDVEKEVAEVKENGISESEEAKTPDSESVGDNLNETEKSPENTENKVEETAEAKKQKEKKKKKWSFRSISFSKKDKSKPGKESEKNGDVKEVAEENVEEIATSPSTESPKTEKPESPESTPVLNGDASKEDVVSDLKSEASVDEPKKEETTLAELDKVEPNTEPVPEPKVEEPKAEEAKPVEAEPPKVLQPVVESDPSIKEQEEPSPTNPLVEEIKEVRNEELPPPLPSSNPPSSVTVFAESTKADILITTHIDLLETVSAEPTVKIMVSEVESTAISDVELKLPAQELSEHVTDFAVCKEYESNLEISSENISETEVVKESEPKPDIISEKNIVESLVTATDIEKPHLEFQNSETEVAEPQEVASDSSVSEIKVASESLASIPDPELWEPEAVKQLKADVISETKLSETKIASLESKTLLEPQPAEINLLKEISNQSIISLSESEHLAETCPSSGKSVVEFSDQTTSEILEPICSLNSAVLEPKVSVKPKVELEINSETSIPEVLQQKSEPQLEHETEPKSELLTMSSDISETYLNQANETDPAESLSSIPPHSVDLSLPPNVTEDSEIALLRSEEKQPTEIISLKISTYDLSKDCLQSSDKAEKGSTDVQRSDTSEDSLQSAKSEDKITNSTSELQPSVTSEDSLQFSQSEDKSEKYSTELQPVSTEVIHSQLSLVYSEESSDTLPASDCVPTEEPKILSTVDDSEGKSASEDFPIDLPYPTDLPPPSSIIIDRIVDPADSLPDISTESLPSLPEPISENLAEPMSLPPVDSIPEPIATDCLIPSEYVPLSHPVLTNGNTNGLPSPSDEDAQTLKEGQLKQVPTEASSELVKDDAEKVAPAEVATVEE